MAVVDCNSFTEAAKQYFISQSAISQQIQALGRELDVELIHRENRRFSLTPAGEYFYRQSEVLFDEVDEFKRETIRTGKAERSKLWIGYLKSCSGRELHMAATEFSRLYPKISIDVTAGTHEEPYNRIRSGGVDIVIGDQRRTFSEEYENQILLECECFAEISGNHYLSTNGHLTLEELRQTSCILITPAGQRDEEAAYYRNTLGSVGKFLYAGNLGEGRLVVPGSRGLLPLRNIGTISPVMPAIRRIPLHREDMSVERTICAFWLKKNTSYYIEGFADILHHFLKRSHTSQFRQQRCIKLFDRKARLQSFL